MKTVLNACIAILAAAITAFLILELLAVCKMFHEKSRSKLFRTIDPEEAAENGDSARIASGVNVYNLIILDESGSMQFIREPALNGANETIRTIQAAQGRNPEQKQFLTFVSFSDYRDERFRVLIDNEPIDSVKPLTYADYIPSGNTPLWDAMGYSLSKLERIVTDEDMVLVTIITDGYENSSKDYSRADIKALVKRLSDKDWAFAYIGANQEAIEVAGSMGINNALNFTADKNGTDEMWRKERDSRIRYYSRERAGISKERLKEDYFSED